MNKLKTVLFCISLCLGFGLFAMDRSQHVELFSAIQSGDLKEVQRLIAEGVPANARNVFKSTALCLASQWDKEAICKLLIENKASVNAKNINERVPLHQAAQNGHERICRLLIENKATIDTQNNRCNTPLTLAAKNRKKKVCHLLIDVQLESARKNKAAIVALLGVVKNKKSEFLKALQYPLPYGVAQIIARQMSQSISCAKQHIIEQFDNIPSAEMKTKLLAYVNKKLNEPILL